MSWIQSRWELNLCQTDDDFTQESPKNRSLRARQLVFKPS
jgi:hypothetical protein